MQQQLLHTFIVGTHIVVARCIVQFHRFIECLRVNIARDQQFTLVSLG